MAAAYRPFCGKLLPPTKRGADRYKGWPYLYRKEAVMVTLNGKPSRYYYSVILQGHRSAEFDGNILKQTVRDSIAIEQHNSFWGTSKTGVPFLMPVERGRQLMDTPYGRQMLICCPSLCWIILG